MRPPGKRSAMTPSADPTAASIPHPEHPRRWRALAAAATAALLLAAGCGEDAVSNGEAPEADGEPPQDPRPQDNEQEAPNAEDADLSGNEEPGLQEGGEENGEEQD